MDTQQERSRQDEDNVADKNIDTTRSENQQRSATDDAGGGKEGYGSERGNPEHNHHSHQEGAYEKE